MSVIGALAVTAIVILGVYYLVTHVRWKKKDEE